MSRKGCGRIGSNYTSFYIICGDVGIMFARFSHNIISVINFLVDCIQLAAILFDTKNVPQLLKGKLRLIRSKLSSTSGKLEVCEIHNIKRKLKKRTVRGVFRFYFNENAIRLSGIINWTAHNGRYY